MLEHTKQTFTELAKENIISYYQNNRVAEPVTRTTQVLAQIHIIIQTLDFLYYSNGCPSASVVEPLAVIE